MSSFFLMLGIPALYISVLKGGLRQFLNDSGPSL